MEAPMTIRNLANDRLASAKPDSSAPKFRRIIFWLLLILLNGLVPTYGATNNYDRNFESPPPKIGSVQWELNQRMAKERQELYRKRLSIPDAVGENVPHANALNAAYSRASVMTQAQAPAADSGRLPGILFLAGVVALAWFLTVRKFSPEILVNLNQRFNPWAADLLPASAFTDKVRAEEEPFARFLASFRAGQPALSPVVTPEQHARAKEFYAQAASLLGHQQKLLQDIIREPDDLIRQRILSGMCAGMNRLKDIASIPEALPIWRVASALEGLLKQLAGKMGEVTPSTMRTVDGGLGLLGDLCATESPQHFWIDRPLKFLVVDDDLLSRHALSLALNKAFSRPDLVADGEAALASVSQQAYDVIFLDVQMPGMDGFELCTKIRKTALNRATPVVFVTGHDDFDARVKSTLSGGNDLMGKPFLTFEITVKALTLALQSRLPGDVPKASRGREWPNPLPAFTEVSLPVLPAIAAQPEPEPTTGADRFTQAFLSRASRHLEPLRELGRQIPLAPNEEIRQAMLAEGFLRINSLVPKTDGEIIHPAFQMCIALDGLFRKLLEDSKHSSASTLATITMAVDLIEELLEAGIKTYLGSNPPIELLVVDDDLIARRAIVGALQTTFKRPVSVESGEAALALATEKSFDVIFLDVIMPGMDGFEVCSKIRNTDANRTTPVIFITGKNDFAARAEMTRSGGNELLGKPFLTAEITLKALTFALRGRLQQVKPEPRP